ncbi:MAG: hypothetical protein FWH12_02420 [Treponema sp.]|nr:hypothetical protein [Treponema sp.]
MKDLMGRRTIAAKALCSKYALEQSLNIKKKQGTAQGAGFYWTNRTSLAIQGIRGFTIDEDDSIGFGLSHTMEYGVILELGKGRKYAVLEPTIKEVTPKFMEAVKRVFG